MLAFNVCGAWEEQRTGKGQALSRHALGSNALGGAQRSREYSGPPRQHGSRRECARRLSISPPPLRRRCWAPWVSLSPVSYVCGVACLWCCKCVVLLARQPCAHPPQAPRLGAPSNRISLARTQRRRRRLTQHIWQCGAAALGPWCQALRPQCLSPCRCPSAPLSPLPLRSTVSSATYSGTVRCPLCIAPRLS